MQLISEKGLESWSVSDIVNAHQNRRSDERGIAYSECHDQALVGDKTNAFRLMDKEMYWSMSRLQDRSLIIDNGISIWKLIKIITITAGGDGYLNFIGKIQIFIANIRAT